MTPENNQQRHLKERETMNNTKKYTLKEAIEELQTIAASEVLDATEEIKRIKDKKDTEDIRLRNDIKIQEKIEEFKKTRAQQTLM